MRWSYCVNVFGENKINTTGVHRISWSKYTLSNGALWEIIRDHRRRICIRQSHHTHHAMRMTSVYLETLKS